MDSGGRGACCLQAGVRGSSPLSSTGQKHNSNSRTGCTAVKYSNRDCTRYRTFEPGLCSLPTAVGPARRSPGSGPLSRKNSSARVRTGSRVGVRRLRMWRITVDFRRFSRGSTNSKLFPSPTVKYSEIDKLRARIVRERPRGFPQRVPHPDNVGRSFWGVAWSGGTALLILRPSAPRNGQGSVMARGVSKKVCLR